MKEDLGVSKDVQIFLERFSDTSVKDYALSRFTKDDNLEQDFLKILDEEYQKFSDQATLEPYYEAIKHNIKKYTEYIQDKLKDKITSTALEDIINENILFPAETKEIVKTLIRLEEQESIKVKTTPTLNISQNIKKKIAQYKSEYDQHSNIEALDNEIEVKTKLVKDAKGKEKERLNQEIKIAAFSRLSDKQLKKQKKILEYNRDKYSLDENELAALSAINNIIAIKQQHIDKEANAWVDSLLKQNLTPEEKLKEKLYFVKEAARSITDQEAKDLIIAMYYDTCKDLRDHYAKQAMETKDKTTELQARIKKNEMIYIICKDQAFENLNSGNIKWYNNDMLKAFEAEGLLNKYRLDLHHLQERKEKFVATRFRFEKDRIDHFFSEDEQKTQDELLHPKTPALKLTKIQKIRHALSAIATSLKNYMLPSNNDYKTIPTTESRNNSTDRTH